jgi:hypothetical protein
VSRQPTQEDLRACGTLLNTLHAEHQGAFTHATVLAKLDHPAFEEGRVPQLQGLIKTIGAWAQRLWQRDPILFADGGGNAPEDLEKALLLLDRLATRLETVGRGLEGALDTLAKHSHDESEPQEAGVVLAGLAWASYAHENELRGIIHQGETLDDPELAERARDQLPIAEDGLAVLHHLLSRIEEPGPPGCDLIAEIHRSAAHLPRLYGAKTEALRELADEIRELRD